MDTLFGHLALKFGSHPENLATEALNYVLAESAEARRLFTVTLSRSGAVVPEQLRFETQVVNVKGAIPDLVGFTISGGKSVIVEAKFWAGLTDRQPDAYLEDLPPGGLLTFVAPAQRFEALWPQLLTRCRQKGRLIEAEEDRGPNWRVARLADGRRLALTSWRAVLADLHGGLVQAGEIAASADILQLQGLAHRMDTDAFLPLTAEELTSNLGRRVTQLCQVVDAVLDTLEGEKLADTKGCKSSGAKHGEYSQFFKLHRAGCRLLFNPYGWAKYGHPIWLEVRDADWKIAWPAANEALRPLANELPPGLIATQWGGFIPLSVPINSDWDAVVEHVTAQIRKVASLLATVA